MTKFNTEQRTTEHGRSLTAILRQLNGTARLRLILAKRINYNHSIPELKAKTNVIKEKKNWLHAAGVLWAILAKSAAKARTMTYEEVAPFIDTNPLSVRRALAPIQDHCIAEHLPPLTSIVVQKNSGVPGGGFIAWDVDDLAAAHSKVFATNWASVVNPYGNFGIDDDFDSLAESVIDAPDSTEKTYAKVPVRGIAQIVFRQALLKAYDCKCAICGLSYESALEAAHIVPWSNSSKSQRLDPRNGILLCATHHRLFDAHVMTVSRSLKVVHYDPNEEQGQYSKADREASSLTHGRDIFKPEDKKLWPNPSLLTQRHELGKWGNLP